MDNKNKRYINYTDKNGSHTITIEIIRSARKTGQLSIDNSCNATLRIPNSADDKWLDELLMDRTDWLIAKHIEMRKRSAAAQNAAKERPHLTDRQRALLEKRYRKSASEYLTLRVNHYERLIGVKHKKIVIRDQKTRWGSCSSSGTLSFNWRLMLAPPQILDYVVVHELCHFVHMDHSPAFWALVAKYMPDYKERRAWLKSNGDLLYF
ncbi:M48 family metallopeptidase [Butyrivibrio sp. MC2013]|uniref:M48 family metallopeptidase n=1 Tax=Butyrivibrio sp. MC2013 TaxID=1280686 RepID=UPI0004260ECD|nr:M48 family metallopeptidase [Butyrivibrio sp. MC2013]